jgi:hypothetical protein
MVFLRRNTYCVPHRCPILTTPQHTIKNSRPGKSLARPAANLTITALYLLFRFFGVDVNHAVFCLGTVFFNGVRV